MSDINIFEHAISNVNFMEKDGELMLFIYTTFEVNVDDVRFYLDEEDGNQSLLLHYPSDLMITIPLKNEDIYKKLRKSKILRVFEVDTVDGSLVVNYNAVK